MIAVGREAMCTAPLAAYTVAGKLLLAAGLAGGVAGWELPHAAQAAARAAAAARAGRRRERTRMIILRRVVEDEVRPLRHRRGHRNEPPFLRGQYVGTGQASGLIPRGGITVAGQRRHLTGFAGSAPSWVNPGQPVPYRARKGRAALAGRPRAAWPRPPSCDHTPQARP